MKRKNVKGLALTPAAAKPPPPAEARKDDEQLEIGIEYKLDLKPEDLNILKELGSGNGGTVSKVKHMTTGTVMARKVSGPWHTRERIRGSPGGWWVMMAAIGG